MNQLFENAVTGAEFTFQKKKDKRKKSKSLMMRVQKGNTRAIKATTWHLLQRFTLFIFHAINF